MSTSFPATPDRTLRPALREKRRVLIGSVVGTSVEWYDYQVYSLASALVIGPLFFPSLSTLAGTLAAFATFGVGFVARPLGGVLAGHFGDRYGRKVVLIATLLLMGVATVGVGLLPGYETIGVAAPILLVALRLLQGLSAGGEWGGAALITVEHAPPGRRGLFGSFTQLGTPAGMLLANVVVLGTVAAMPADAFAAWGWRIPFLLSAVMIFVGLWIRRRVEESPAFTSLAEHAPARQPLLEILRAHPRPVLLALATFLGNNTIGYLFLAFLLSYGTQDLDLPRGGVLAVMLGGMAVWLLATPLLASWSDRAGRKRVYLAGYGLLVVWAVPFWLLVDTGSLALMAVAVLPLVIGQAATYGPQAAMFAEMFPARVRFSGASLAYAMGAVLGGGIAPFVATALVGATDSSLSVAAYMVVVCVVSLVAVIAVRLPSPSAELDPRPTPETRTETRTEEAS